MLGYSHRGLDAYNEKCVFGSRVCRVLLTWAGLGCPGLDPLLYLQPVMGCLGSSMPVDLHTCLELAGSPLIRDGFV